MRQDSMRCPHGGGPADCESVTCLPKRLRLLHVYDGYTYNLSTYVSMSMSRRRTAAAGTQVV